MQLLLHAAAVALVAFCTPRTAAQPTLVTTLAGSATAGSSFADGLGTSALFNSPMYDLAVDASGNVVVSDYLNNRIRLIAPNRTVTTLAGSSTGITSPGLGVNVTEPTGLAISASTSQIYFTSDHSFSIFQLSPATGFVSTLNIAQGATFLVPRSLALDSLGNLLVVDAGHNMIRSIALNTGIVTTLAGNGSTGHTDGPALNATFNSPFGITITCTSLNLVTTPFAS